MTPDELARRYLLSDWGRSVRFLDLTGMTPTDVHGRLVNAGFRGRRVPMLGPRGRAERQLVTSAGALTADVTHAERLFEHVYLHPDGGVVRMFPDGAPCDGLALRQPCARKSVLVREPERAAMVGLEVEAFAVSKDGRPLPKSPCAEHGLRGGDGSALRRLAATTMISSRVLLAPGPAYTLPILEDAHGLVGARSLVPGGEFFTFSDLMDRMQERRWAGARVVRKEEVAGTRFFFTGDPDDDAEHGHIGLTSLFRGSGTHTVGVDPIGNASSRAQLVAFLGELLAKIPCRVLDDATGTDVTELLESFPYLLFSPDTILQPPLTPAVGLA